MTEATLVAKLREKTGKGEAKRLRREGRIPAVLCGPGREATVLSVDARDFFRVYEQAGTHGLVELQITNGDGGRRRVLIKEVQQHPVRGDVVHVDFHAVALDREIETTVPVVPEGEDLRRDDGVVQLVLREVEISCLPTRIPEAIVVNVAELAIGDIVTVGQLKAPPGVTILTDPEETVVTVTPPEGPEAAEGPAAEGETGEEEKAEGEA